MAIRIKRVGKYRYAIPTEHDVQTQIMDWLALNRKWFAWRNNTGGFKKGRHFVHFGYKGSPDIFVLVPGRLIGIEVKMLGKDQSQAQRAFQVEMESRGHKYLLARSLDDVMLGMEKL